LSMILSENRFPLFGIMLEGSILQPDQFEHDRAAGAVGTLVAGGFIPLQRV